MSQTRNTRMRLLMGFVEQDQCDQANDDGKYAEALAVRSRMNNHEVALADFDRALRLSPQRIDLAGRLTRRRTWIT
jgi:tetratricopeptide (TPR) repeat protein